MDLQAAQEQFMVMMQKLSQPDTRKAFICWIQETWMKESKFVQDSTKKTQLLDLILADDDKLVVNITNEIFNYNENDAKLRRISDDLRHIVPLNAVLPSEQITFPTVGENADCDPSHTLHVDAFLYDEDMIDELCDMGELARNYCVDCSSHNTEPITYISHSCSRERLAYIFHALLPPLPDEAVILDVGCRLGAVLYGAYVYTRCRRIIGIEMNSDLCQVQQKILEKYQLQDRIQVICGDVADHGEVIRAADVIIMNNVFDFFVSPSIQRVLWSFLRSTIKRGSLLVVIPSLYDSLQHLDVDFCIEDWVKEVAPRDANITAPFDFQTETSEIKLYQVL